MQAEPSVRLDTASQREASVLAVIYARAIQLYEETKAVRPGGPDDPEERTKNDCRAKSIIPK